MEKKIQVSTVRQEADVQVIALNAYFIAKAVKMQLELENICMCAKDVCKKFNDETKKYEDVLDENGNKTYRYNRVDSEPLVERILPFLQELTKAFEE